MPRLPGTLAGTLAELQVFENILCTWNIASELHRLRPELYGVPTTSRQHNDLNQLAVIVGSLQEPCGSPQRRPKLRANWTPRVHHQIDGPNCAPNRTRDCLRDALDDMQVDLVASAHW